MHQKRQAQKNKLTCLDKKEDSDIDDGADKKESSDIDDGVDKKEGSDIIDGMDKKEESDIDDGMDKKEGADIADGSVKETEPDVSSYTDPYKVTFDIRNLTMDMVPAYAQFKSEDDTLYTVALVRVPGDPNTYIEYSEMSLTLCIRAYACYGVYYLDREGEDTFEEYEGTQYRIIGIEILDQLCREPCHLELGFADGDVVLRSETSDGFIPRYIPESDDEMEKSWNLNTQAIYLSFM